MAYEEGTIIENDAGEQLQLKNGQWTAYNDAGIANNLAAGIGSTAVAMGAPSIRHDPQSAAYMIGQAGDPAMIGLGEIAAPAVARALSVVNLKAGTSSAMNYAKSKLALKVHPDSAKLIEEAKALGLEVPTSVKYNSPLMEKGSTLLQSNPATSWMTGNSPARNAAQVTKQANEAMGLAPDRLINPQTIAEAEKATSASFSELGANAIAPMTKAEARTSIMAGLPESFVGKAKFPKKLDTLLGDYAGETLTGNQLIGLQSSLADLAKAKGSKSAIGAARENLINQFTAASGSTEAFNLAKSQWAAQRLVSESLGARGQLNMSRLAKKITSGGDTPLGLLGRSAKVMNQIKPTTYGTENSVRHGLLGTVAPYAAGAGLTALGSYALKD